MNPFYLKEVRSYTEPYSKELQSMIDTTQERRVDFADGSRGIIIGEFVYAPFYIDKSCLVKKDDKDIVLTFKGVHKMQVAIFELPFPIIVEPLTFRTKRIQKDSFLFYVFDTVTLCRPFPMTYQQGRFEITKRNHFCPVFDRFGHFIGINAGVFNNERLCIPIQEIL